MGNLSFEYATRNPSRKKCEEIILRILKAEFTQKNINTNFRKAADFMNYFESLYPPSDSLTKQVQRAVQALDLPRDEKGFFILDKTRLQLDQDKEMKQLLTDADFRIDSLEGAEQIFLQLNRESIDFIIHKLGSMVTLREKIVTLYPCVNGIMIVTREKEDVLKILQGFVY